MVSSSYRSTENNLVQFVLNPIQMTNPDIVPYIPQHQKNGG